MPYMNNVVYKEEGFSIRTGHRRYFILHDPCTTVDDQHPRPGIAHDTKFDGEVIHSGECRTCGKEYSEEMSGFIQLLNWER